MEVPFELLYGVDVAIKKLRPGASFTLFGTTFADWIDPEGKEPPTWEEVMFQMEADKKIYDEWVTKNQSDAE
jgi:hypothetical protein